MLKEIWSLLRPLDILLLLLLSLLALLSNLGLLGAAAWLISSAALQPPLYALTLGITAVRALGIGRALLRYGERYFTHKNAFSVLAELRLRLYDTANHLASFPQAAKTKGTLLHDMLTGAEILRDFLLRGLLPPLTLLLAVLLITLLLSPYLSYGIFILPILYLSHCLPLWLSPQQSSSSHYRSQLLDFAQGSHELSRAGSLNVAVTQLDQTAKHWQKNLFRDKTRTNRIDFLLGLLRIFAFLWLFILLLTALQQKQIDGITLCTYLLVLLALLNEFAALPAAARHFRQAQQSADWLRPHAAPPSPNAAPLATNLLTVSDLEFHYPQGLPVFSTLSFSLSPGCHTAIVGDSGSGKTTLASLLSGLWAPTKGSIHYGSAVRPFVCTIPQGSFLFAGSIRENFLRLHPAITADEIQQALQTAQLTAVWQKLPQGLDTPLGENACHLSGGERNRLASALILASSAPVLLFDEPTAGLDLPKANKLLYAILKRADQTGQTVVIITHDLPQLSRFSQIIRLTPSQS